MDGRAPSAFKLSTVQWLLLIGILLFPCILLSGFMYFNYSKEKQQPNPQDAIPAGEGAKTPKTRHVFKPSTPATLPKHNVAPPTTEHKEVPATPAKHKERPAEV